jgi:hypothetical protein
MARCTKNLLYATRLGAHAALLAGGGVIDRKDRWVFWKADRFVRFARAAAKTIGTIIFVRDPNLTDDDFLIAHEFIHIMRYSGSAGFADQYADTWLNNGCTVGPGGRVEAIAYLWSAWLENYHRYGGPTARLPQEIRRTPTRAQVETLRSR